jgi:hypothetical protein
MNAAPLSPAILKIELLWDIICMKKHGSSFPKNGSVETLSSNFH